MRSSIPSEPCRAPPGRRTRPAIAGERGERETPAMTTDDPNVPVQYRTPEFVADYQGIHVDAAGLDKFHLELGQDVEKNFQPHVQRLFGMYEQGPPFGDLTFSQTVQNARTRQHECANAASKSLAGYVNATKILVAAIKEIREQYGNADGLAAGNVAAVDAILTQVGQDARTASAEASLDAQSGQQALDIAHRYAPVSIQEQLANSYIEGDAYLKNGVKPSE